MTIKQHLARAILRLFGWRAEGERPEAPQFVMIAAPHTSNWDFPLLLLYAAAFDINMSWLGKHHLFKPHLGWFMRLVGGVPVYRHENRNLVEDMAATFKDHEDLVIVIPAEGTRRRSEYWKSGFYHVARTAGVPIVPSYLDYGQKRGGFGPVLTPTGDVATDMDFFREFYAPMRGKYPEYFGPIRLREEASEK
ncbi:MAG: lysophospholipid acyltransferase family protein [Pseudomonadota bacterium]